MSLLPAILSLIVAAAGWHYLFYSRAAHRLGAVEPAPLNRRRILLRRINAVFMLLLGVFFFAGNYTVQEQPPSKAFAIVWLVVAALLIMITILALVDLRLTMKLRRRP
jgi:drug/metabolite transporter (DMT)-like permease